jgi:hypothetical protein
VFKLLIPAGGLGNQLFTWNAAHYLGEKSKGRIFIIYPKENKLGDRKNILRPLSQFCEHRIAIVNSDLIYKFVKLRDRFLARIPRISWIVDTLLLICKKNNPEAIITRFEHIKLLYVGYFQNSEFVLENLAAYISEFRALEVAVLENIYEKTEVKPSQVGVHIRRGDFVQNAATIGVLSSLYFTPLEENNCLVSCESKSDVPSAWAENRIVSGEKYSEWESFFLLSNCEEIWISNSTFSWWAGLYGEHAHASRVIAPNPWNKIMMYSPEYLKIKTWQYRAAKFDDL